MFDGIESHRNVAKCGGLYRGSAQNSLRGSTLAPYMLLCDEVHMNSPCAFKRMADISKEFKDSNDYQSKISDLCEEVDTKCPHVVFFQGHVLQIDKYSGT